MFSGMSNSFTHWHLPDFVYPQFLFKMKMSSGNTSLTAMQIKQGQAQLTAKPLVRMSCYHTAYQSLEAPSTYLYLEIKDILHVKNSGSVTLVKKKLLK